MKALIFDNKVVQVQETEFEVSPTMIWVDCPDDCIPGWDFVNGDVVRPVIPEKTLPEILHEFNQGLQNFINSVSMQKQYESALHCATYATSTVAEWAAEAQAFIAWRDSVWTYSYAELAKFENSERQPVSFEDFLTELPAIVWPN